MRIGIDFGTSYSAAGVLVNDRVELLAFGPEHQFRTTAYFRQPVPDPGLFALTPALEVDVERLVRASRTQDARRVSRARALREQAARAPKAIREEQLRLVPEVQPRTEAQMRSEAVMAVRRAWLEEQVRSADRSPASLQDAIYGDAAIEAYLTEGGGHLVDSPKTMLGFALEPRARTVLQRIATYILEHIRLTAVQQLGVDVRSAVIGRPVRFRSSIGDAGGVQALEILREAAGAAGFDDVAFLEEPSAAAMGYHRTQHTVQRCLVVDIGGGTTDVALARVGGRAATPEVLGAWGVPLGGQDVDLALSLRQFMPLLGKNDSRIPVHFFSAAARVHELHRQREFLRHDFSGYPAPYARRLAQLQEFGNTVRLNWQVELTKKLSSDSPKVGAPLDFIEKGLLATATQHDLARSAERYLRELTLLLETARVGMGAPPDSILLTGGMSRAPYVQAAVEAAYPGVAVTRGDPSLGVVTGLAIAARAP